MPPASGLLDRLGGLVSSTARRRRALMLLGSDEVRVQVKGARLLVRAARTGDREAQYNVGLCYVHGRGIPPSQAEAFRWLERAAKAGHADAMVALASQHLGGLAEQVTASVFGEVRPSGAQSQLKADFGAAERWARQAAGLGSVEAKAVLGFIHAYAPPPLHDLVKAEHYYRAAAVAGSVRGAMGLGTLLLQHRGEEATAIAEAAVVLRKAAAHDLPTACYLLGGLYELGQGVERDPTTAVHLYRQSANKGFRPAQVRLGIILLKGSHGVPRDTVEAETWLRRAGRAGHAESAALVGNLYATANGDLPPNYAEAAIWFHRAAELGHSGAADALARMCQAGKGTPRDIQAAVRWFARAGELGHAESIVALGTLIRQYEAGAAEHEKGLVQLRALAEAGNPIAAWQLALCLAEQVEPDLPIERSWFIRAAEAGVTDAQVRAAEMMANGRGGPRDPQAALDLFRRAAEKGHIGAMFATGVMLNGGHNVETDRNAAQGWFHKAAKAGHGAAQLVLGRYLARGAEARRWLELAKAAGVPEAAQELARLDLGEECRLGETVSHAIPSAG